MRPSRKSARRSPLRCAAPHPVRRRETIDTAAGRTERSKIAGPLATRAHRLAPRVARARNYRCDWKDRRPGCASARTTARAERLIGLGAGKACALRAFLDAPPPANY